MYDAIVVGARCAGSATAMLLARKGFKVLLVDRSTFPSDTISTHYVWARGTARLQRWGLLEEVQASNCPPIRQMRMDVGPFALEGMPPPYEGQTEFYAPRRTILDKVLLDGAARAGVEVREGFSVSELVWDGGGVTGIRGSDNANGAVAESARIVIGADGKHSAVARAVGAPVYNEKPATEFGYYSYWSGVPVGGIEVSTRDRCEVLAFPTNDALTLALVFGKIEDFSRFRSNIEAGFWECIDKVPELAQRMRSGRQEERFYGTAELTNFFRRPFGPGWALVGDAGFCMDPNTAQGISNALRDADYLADAIGEGFSGSRPLEDALAAYQARRDEESMPIYELNAEFATLDPPPPEMQQLLAAIKDRPEEVSRFFGTLAGTTPIPEFFAPENVERLVAEGAF